MTHPEYRAAVEAVEARRAERVRAERLASKPILDDLRKVGHDVKSVWNLGDAGTPYPAALPILMDHFERGGYPDGVMESLGRCLGHKPAVIYSDRLKARFLKPRTPGEREWAAIALAGCATKAQLDDLFEFLADEELGDARIYFIRPILRMGRERGWTTIEALCDHPILGIEATARVKSRRKKPRPAPAAPESTTREPARDQ